MPGLVRVMSGIKEKDSLNDLPLRRYKTSAALSEVSGNRSDASSIRTFQLAGNCSHNFFVFFVLKLVAAEVM